LPLRAFGSRRLKGGNMARILATDGIEASAARALAALGHEVAERHYEAEALPKES
jgi:hypothetical protein